MLPLSVSNLRLVPDKRARHQAIPFVSLSRLALTRVDARTNPRFESSENGLDRGFTALLLSAVARNPSSFPTPADTRNVLSDTAAPIRQGRHQPHRPMPAPAAAQRAARRPRPAGLRHASAGPRSPTHRRHHLGVGTFGYHGYIEISIYLHISIMRT
jgi:hypothetical protein